MFNSEWFVDISVKQLTGATLLKLVDKLNSETAKPLRESTIGLQDDGSGEFQFEDLQGLAFLPLLNTSIQQSGDVNYYLRTKMNQKELTEQERIEVRSIILNWTETLVHLIDLDLSIKFNNSERDLRLKALIEGLLSLASNKNESFVRFGATTFNHAPSGLLAHFRLNIERLCEYCMKN